MIKLPDEIVKSIFDGVYCGIIDRRVYDAIKDGTPLQKGHGDLVDMSQLDSKMYHMAFETDTDLQKWDSGCWIRYKLYEDIRDAMPVIIGAESEE